MRKFPISWTSIKGLPSCYDHSQRAVLPKDHAVMIQQVNAFVWRVIYTYPFSEFLAKKEVEIASEGRAVISYSAEMNQVTILHELGCFNRCRIAGRFYIEKYMELEG